MPPVDRLALPVVDGRFCLHFGRAAEFFICDVERDAFTPGRTRTVVKRFKPGECESVPEWLKAMAVSIVLAGGIGPVAQQRLASLGIGLVTGLKGDDPIQVVSQWLDRTQRGGANSCKQDSHQVHHCRTRRLKS